MRELHGQVVVCGIEELGLRVLEELCRLGEPCVAIAHTSEPRYAVEARRLGVPIVQGDPADPATLRQAGVPGARSIVFTTDGDVANIHGALAAVALDPAIHVVLRAFDDEFGRSIETLIPGAVALSTSALAAPGFVSALLDQGGERRVDMLGRDLVLRIADPSDPAVLAVLADEGRRPVELFPPVVEVAADAGPVRRLCIVDASGDPARVVAGRRSRRLPLPLLPRPSLLRRIDRRFWVLSAVILTLVLIAALVIQLRLPNLGVADAIFQAFEGLVGNPDSGTLDTSDLKLLAIILAIVGAILLAAFYGLVVDVLMKARVSSILGPHARDARDHVIIVGFGSLGYRVGMALRDQGIGVVAADARPDSRFSGTARERGIAIVETDARSADLLRTLHLDRARALLVATDDDAANLATALRARAIRPDLRIAVRLFDPDLAVRLEAAFGGFESRSIHGLAAPAFAAAALGLTVLVTIPVGTSRVLIAAQVPVEDGSAADGSTVAEEEGSASSVEQGGCRILALVDQETVRWKPGPEERIGAGQELLAVGTRAGLAVTVHRGQHHPGSPASEDLAVDAPRSVAARVVGAVVDRLRALFS